MFRLFLFLFIVHCLGVGGYIVPVGAATLPQTPSLPDPIAALQKEGAQLKYLGRDLGFDGWIAIKNGQEQYFYVTPDGSAFFLGVLFNKNGRAVTFDQMKRLQGVKDSALNDLENAPSQAAEPVPPSSLKASRSAMTSTSLAEQLMQDVINGHSFTLGTAKTAPVIYMFADPLCPHCKDMIRLLDPAVSAGQIQVKILMVGALSPDSAPLAAGILSQKNPGAALRDLIAGQKQPVKGDKNDPRIVENLDIMIKWKFTGTPVAVYRDKKGMIKILQGPPKSLDILMQDLR